MSRAVTWTYLDAEQVHRCLAAHDKSELTAALIDANVANKGNLLAAPLSAFPLQPEQERILVDLYTHLIRFAQGMGFSPEKVSTLVGVVAQSHIASMGARSTNVQAYKDFEARLVAHSVHRPPFSAQVFSLQDAKCISDFMLTTYFRHYKLYLYAFTPRETAELKTISFATPHNIPPVHIQPMSKSIPLAQWEAAHEEQRRIEEERLAKIAEDEAAAEAEEERLAQEAGRPQMTAGLKQQLDVIKTTVTKLSRDQLDALESKLVALEHRMADVNKPMSAGAVKAPVKPPSKK